MPVPVDIKQIIYALERQALTLEGEADRLGNAGDYDAMFPEADAERLREAIVLLGRMLGRRSDTPRRKVVDVNCGFIRRMSGHGRRFDDHLTPYNLLPKKT